MLIIQQFSLLSPYTIKRQRMQKLLFIFIATLSFSICSCQSSDSNEEETMIENEILMEDEQEANMNMDRDRQAVITAIQISGTENNYSFNVTIESPDTGCQQYADWWEVFDQEGNLLYRRILGHSHVEEQPFTRSGGPINIPQDQVVYVRAHMNPFGYGSFGFVGSVKEGFKEEMISLSTASGLETTAPLPKNCAF